MYVSDAPIRDFTNYLITDIVIAETDNQANIYGKIAIFKTLFSFYFMKTIHCTMRACKINWLIS